MATYLRQLYYLLYKNAIFKWRHKTQTAIEVLVAFSFPAVVLSIIWNKTIYPTYGAIPSSKQVVHKSDEIPGWKSQHLAYVTNVNASEFKFFLWFYSLPFK